MNVRRGPTDDPNLSDAEVVAQRTQWFHAYTSSRNVTAGPSDEMYPCPCCGHRTLGERGAYEICDECGWEDDGQDNHDSAVVRGGPNGKESLDEARLRYRLDGGVPGEHEPPVEPR